MSSGASQKRFVVHLVQVLWRSVVLCASACNVASVFCCLFQSVTK